MEEEQKQNTQQAKEEHTATSPKHMSIRSILGGDILANDFFKTNSFTYPYYDINGVVH